MEQNLTKEDCIILLKEKFQKLDRLPKKSDFTDYQVMMIKSHLGPWPRALEFAGLKSVNNEKLLKKQEKRERTKQRKKEYKNV